jgi:hypothetical protein
MGSAVGRLWMQGLGTSLGTVTRKTYRSPQVEQLHQNTSFVFYPVAKHLLARLSITFVPQLTCTGFIDRLLEAVRGEVRKRWLML